MRREDASRLHVATDAEIRRILTEIRRLLDSLENPQGSVLNPKEVAEQLAAIRQRHVEIPSQSDISIVLKPWDDWSDLSNVPLDALGLQRRVYRKLKDASINTVGVLVAHSQQGLQASGVFLKQPLMSVLLACLHRRVLTLAENNTQIPLDFVINRKGQPLFGGWTKEEQLRFAQALNVRTLGDMSRLKATQIKRVPFAKYTITEPFYFARPMSSDNPDDLKFVVDTINSLLEKYELPLIQAD